jgi:hypothetical protein
MTEEDMSSHDPLYSGRDRFAAVTGGPPADRPGVRTVTTRDRDTIVRWAERHGAEPATGEASTSGPATRTVVNDTGAGIRFNFPGFARFRPISWDEWFGHFVKHDLLFVFEEEDEEQVAERAHERWQARGGTGGDGKTDWFEAERDLQRAAGNAAPGNRYRLVKQSGEDAG